MSFCDVHSVYSRRVGEPKVNIWPSNLQTEVAQSRMVIWTTALRPAEQPIRLGDPHIIDAGIPMMHDSFRSKLPILVAICAVPLSRIVVKFICKSYGYPISIERPELFDKTIVKLSLPFAHKEAHNLFTSSEEFCTVPPLAIRRISQGNLLGVARIPSVFGLAY